MGSRGRVTAAFSFSWDSIAQQTREIYYEQRNKHDTPPNWTYSSEGDETLAFALIGPVRLFPTAVIGASTLLHSTQRFLGSPISSYSYIVCFWQFSLFFGGGIMSGFSGLPTVSFCQPYSSVLPCICVFFRLISSFAHVISCLLFAFAFLCVAGNV